MTAAGTAMATIAHRQPSTPPASAATAPTRNGPTTSPSGRPTPSIANMRVRTPMGYLSAINDGEMGRRDEAPKPAQERRTPIENALLTVAVNAMNPDHRTVAPARILVR